MDIRTQTKGSKMLKLTEEARAEIISYIANSSPRNNSVNDAISLINHLKTLEKVEEKEKEKDE